jgi:hypothetical protein
VNLLSLYKDRELVVLAESRVEHPKSQLKRKISSNCAARRRSSGLIWPLSVHEGMSSLLQLNDLAISQKYGITIKQQYGYVAPPLNGIWARWPYFHNNSAPTLCDVLVAAEQRQTRYVVRASDNSETDFDSDCNGYPKVSVREFRRAPRPDRVTLGRPGLGNQGHDEGIFIKKGRNLLDARARSDLIRFLQTL